MKVLNWNKFLLTIFFCFSVHADECSKIKGTLEAGEDLSQETTLELNEIIKKFNATKQAEDKDLCNLNVIGKMLYQGNYFDKNVEAAENLFYFLSNKDYPEAQFNFSLLASKNLSHNPQDIINLLLGIYAKYISDSEYSHLSTKAKLLLEGYVGNLKNAITDCAQVKMKGNTCHPAFSKLTHAGAQELYLSANNALIKTNMNFYKTMAIGTQRQKEKWDTIMTIVSIGALAYSLSAPSYSSPGTSYAPSDPCGGFLTAGCGFEWNPMNLPQIQ